MIPMIIENNRVVDLASRLLEDRIVLINGPVNDHMAESVNAQILYLESKMEADIYVYVNSPGGAVTAGLSMYDTMKFVNSRIITVGTGQCCSMGSFLLAAGDVRYALPNCRVMIHQPLGGFQGQASDFEIHAKEILSIKDKLNRMLADFTKQPLDKIEADTDRDNFMSAAEAKEYGLIDEVIKSINDLK
ncbi:MAG: ATP-dependent Clp protease proteolytic subunit [Sphingobium sp.]|nr:ATP-dependent Clp protease proteolytic subunit [Sphingobium sp.]MBS50060.1 ATP-dependent Clp protease proteolytic subunit [Sphingobium sp.]|tara:strand:+ start:76075 stop:76641 length:567 start_codon:yes stop_codon:yes gene_type:complete